MAFRSLETWMERQEEVLNRLEAQQSQLCMLLDSWMEQNSGRGIARRASTCSNHQLLQPGDAWIKPTKPGRPEVRIDGPIRTSYTAAARASRSLGQASVRTDRTDSIRCASTVVSVLDLEKLDQSTATDCCFTRESFSRFVVGTKFDAIFACVVLANFMFIGVQMEFKNDNLRVISTGYMDSMLMFIDFAFTVAFLLELIMRLVGIGIVEFFCSEKEWAWNWFDVIVVFLTTVETALGIFHGLMANNLKGVSSLRVVRVMRVLRVVRVIRGMRNFRPLRLLIQAIANTLRSAIWTLLLLIMIIYTFGVMIGQWTNEFLALQPPDSPENEPLITHYGSLGRTLYTLFSASTGGCDWQQVASPLERVHWACLVGFVIYISFQYFCVMNVVTGIFCQSALEIAKNDREDMIAQQLQDKEKYISALEDLFAEWDRSGSGEITLEQFQNHIEDSRMQAFLRTLDIESSNALTLFKLLDADGEGTLDVSEFVNGLIELRGTAKSIQIHELLRESSLARENLQRMFDYLVAVEEEKLAREIRENADDSGTGSTTDSTGMRMSSERFMTHMQPTRIPPAAPPRLSVVPPPDPPHVVAIDEV